MAPGVALDVPCRPIWQENNRRLKNNQSLPTRNIIKAIAGSLVVDEAIAGHLSS